MVASPYFPSMMFDLSVRTVLEYYTNYTPSSEDAWYGPWNSILNTLFPSAQGYIVTPQRRLTDVDQSHIPDFVIEVLKISSPPLTLRTILIVEVKNSQHWEHGTTALYRQIGRQTDAAFAGTAHGIVYWIGAIGPHWRFGHKLDDGGDIESLIEWQPTIHDQISYNHLQHLASLISSL